MNTFPQYKYDELLYEMPLLQLFIMHSWSMQNDVLNRFSGIRATDGGYAGQEADSLLSELKKMMNKNNK